MNKRNLIIGLLIVVLSSYYAFKNVSFEELVNALKSVHYIYLIPSLFLVFLTFLFRGMRWCRLIGSVKKDVKLARIWSPLMIGFMSNILPARAGEVIRAYLLGKKEDISFSASFATIFVERLMDMMIFLFLLIGVLIFSADTFIQGENGENHRLMGYMIKFGWFSFIGSIGIFSFSVLLQYKNDWAMKIVEFCTKPLPDKWRDKIIGMVHSFTDGLKILKDPKSFIISLFLSVLVWAAMISTYYPINMAFGLESEMPAITSIIIISVSIGIFISLFPTPGFLGAFQAACVVALHEIFGISKAVSASYGIIAWIIAMGSVILAGLFFVLKDNVSFSELSKSTEKAE